MSQPSASTAAPIQRALQAARETRELRIGGNILGAVPDVFQNQFGDRKAIIVGDATTMRVAGDEVINAMTSAGRAMVAPFIFTDPALYAEHKFVEQLQASLAVHDAIPIAVGSGSINDIVKLAAHRAGRQYMSVATAASMDGYTAFGASITFNGCKQTFTCPAPQAVVADLEIIRAAPTKMTASGYADLLAKITAGADWILADALGVEPIDAIAWDLVQSPLHASVADPAGVRNGEINAISKLTEGLIMGGFAMQATQSSRPASGAEHQFSHLWDMQHHTHNGAAPSHGFKVGIGTLAVARMYEDLLSRQIETLDIDQTISHWPDWPQLEQKIRDQFDIAELRDKSIEESKAKYIDRNALRDQIKRLQQAWPSLRSRLSAQLLPSKKLAAMLDAAGALSSPGQIGISADRLHKSHRQALYIRRRFTILDVADRLGILP